MLIINFDDKIPDKLYLSDRGWNIDRCTLCSNTEGLSQCLSAM